jgi:hypothetical protein
MQQKMKIVALACVTTLLALPGLGLAEKGGKGKGNKGGEEGSRVALRATFGEVSFPTACPTDKICADVADPYEDGKGGNFTGLLKDTGQLSMAIFPAGGRTIFFQFDEQIEGTGGICYDHYDNIVNNVTAPVPERVTATGASIRTHNEFGDTSGVALDLRTLPPGESHYVEFFIRFHVESVDGPYDVRFNKTLESNDPPKQLTPGVTRGMVQITTFDERDDSELADGITDRWVLTPIPDPSQVPCAADADDPPCQPSQANLHLFTKTEGKRNAPSVHCNLGDFIVPFELTLTRK